MHFVLQSFPSQLLLIIPLLLHIFLKKISMGFDKKPDFNIHLDVEVFDKFVKQRIFEDIMDIGLEKEDTKFFKQFNFIAQFTRGKQMKNLLVHLLRIIRKNEKRWFFLQVFITPSSFSLSANL
jgi:hypothetical protein